MFCHVFVEKEVSVEYLTVVSFKGTVLESNANENCALVQVVSICSQFGVQLGFFAFWPWSTACKEAGVFSAQLQNWYTNDVSYSAEGFSVECLHGTSPARPHPNFRANVCAT